MRDTPTGVLERIQPWEWDFFLELYLLEPWGTEAGTKTEAVIGARLIRAQGGDVQPQDLLFNGAQRLGIKPEPDQDEDQMSAALSDAWEAQQHGSD